MKVSARILSGSFIDRKWRHHSRLGGDVHGVRFRLQEGTFVSDDISPGALDRLLSHPAIIVEFVTESVGQAVIAEDTEIIQEAKRPRGRPRKAV